MSFSYIGGYRVTRQRYAVEIRIGAPAEHSQDSLAYVPKDAILEHTFQLEDGEVRLTFVKDTEHEYLGHVHIPDPASGAKQ